MVIDSVSILLRIIKGEFHIAWENSVFPDASEYYEMSVIGPSLVMKTL